MLQYCNKNFQEVINVMIYALKEFLRRLGLKEAVKKLLRQNFMSPFYFAVINSTGRKWVKNTNGGGGNKSR